MVDVLLSWALHISMYMEQAAVEQQHALSFMHAGSGLASGHNMWIYHSIETAVVKNPLLTAARI